MTSSANWDTMVAFGAAGRICLPDCKFRQKMPLLGKDSPPPTATGTQSLSEGRLRWTMSNYDEVPSCSVDAAPKFSGFPTWAAWAACGLAVELAPKHNW